MRKNPKKAKPASGVTPPAPAPLPPSKAKLAALGRSPIAYLLTSLLLLVPCFWQSRLQLGDLSSHIYNAWLAQLIESGRAPGLTIVPQTTNVLFDLILSGLFKTLGAEAAQRISVSLAVLTFVWGAFAFVSVVAGRRAWGLMPAIAMLAYGWVLHMGLFDFYVSLGLCFWALALAWEWKPRRVAAAVPVLIVAYVAHGLPVAWTVALLAYLWLARPMPPPKRAILMAASLAAIVAARAVVTGTMSYIWLPQQIVMITGTDQLWVFDDKYLVPFLGLLLVSVLLFGRLLRASGAHNVLSGLPFQIGVLSAAGVLLVPTRLQIPGYNHALVYIAERMSLAVGVCLCALLAAAPMRAYHRYAMAVMALLFFGFLYRDERALNAFEDRMTRLVSQLPPGQRVVSAIDDPTLRIGALTHMIDRVCLGRCYSYANYEPSTAQFRIRAVAGNPIVVSTYGDSWRLQAGNYVVQQRDLPLYQVDLDQAGNMGIRALAAGAQSGITYWRVL
jgi:hypothetical protein